MEVQRLGIVELATGLVEATHAVATIRNIGVMFTERLLVNLEGVEVHRLGLFELATVLVEQGEVIA